MKTRIYAAPAVKGLTINALKYFCIKHGDQRFFFQFEIIINVLLITCAMGLQPLPIVYSFSAGIDFRRQNLTSTDVRF